MHEYAMRYVDSYQDCPSTTVISRHIEEYVQHGRCAAAVVTDQSDDSSKWYLIRPDHMEGKSHGY